MRKNTTKAKVARGDVAFGFGLSYPAPELVELAAVLGFDFVTFDSEHEPIDEGALVHMLRAAEAYGITPIVRLTYDPGRVLRLLDVGAQGIHIPRINSADQSREVVEACLYYPEGKRTFYALARSADYGINTDDRVYAREANNEILVVCMVEEVEGMNHLQEIIGVPGIDAIHIGPKDLWQSMGMPDETVVLETIDRMIETIVAAGLHVSLTMRLSSDIGERIVAYAAKGVRYFTVSARDLLKHGTEAFFGRVRQQLP
jgi:2-keto-3-deoxy-L-rhamnonate aldolase RhmA